MTKIRLLEHNHINHIKHISDTIEKNKNFGLQELIMLEPFGKKNIFCLSYRSCWAPGAAGRAESCSIALSVLPFFPGWMDEEVKRRVRKSMGHPMHPALLLLPSLGSPRLSLSSLPYLHPPPLPLCLPPPHLSSFPVMWIVGEQGRWSPPERSPSLPPLLYLRPRLHLSRSQQTPGHMTRWGRALHHRLLHLWAARSSRQSGRRSSCSYLAHSEAVDRN